MGHEGGGAVIGPETWLHTGDMILNRQTGRITKIARKVYGQDMRIIFYMEPVSGHKRTRIHEDTLMRSEYERVFTREKILQKEK